MKVIITPRAEAQIATRRAWWRENRRAARDLFDIELAHAVERIGTAPWSFPVLAAGGGQRKRPPRLRLQDAP
jgi:hypothetical protein